MGTNVSASFDSITEVLDQVLRHMPVGVIVGDLFGTILDVNDAFSSMVGLERERLIGRSVLSVVHPDEVDETRDEIAALKDETAETRRVVRRLRSASGKTIWTRITVSLVRANGGAVFAVGFVEDVTGRMAATADGDRSAEVYRRVVEDQTEMIVRWLPDGTRTFVNDAYARFFAMPVSDLIGTSFFPLIVPDDVKMIEDKIRSLTPANPALRSVHRVLAGDGSIRWNEWTDRATFHPSGEIDMIQSVGRDVTDRVEAEEALRRSERRYREMFHALPVAVWEADWSEVVPELRRMGFRSADELIDAVRTRPSEIKPVLAKRRILAVNQHALELFGVPDAQSFALAMQSEASYDGNILEVWRKIAEVVLRTRKAIAFDVRMFRADRTPIDLKLLFTSSDATPGVVLATAIDVTEQKKSEQAAQRQREELMKADRMISLGVVVAGVAHEINNPNQYIMLNAPLLRDACRDIIPIVDEYAAGQPGLRIGGLPWTELRSEMPEVLDEIDRGTERIRSIVSELRTFGGDFDRDELRTSSLNDIVQRSLRLLAAHIRKATNHFNLDLASDLPPIHANPSRLEQVIVNLVLNACQALTSSDQAIVLKTSYEREHGSVELCVSDEGRGISPEHLDQILNPFFTTKRAAGGTGLGLAVSHRIVVDHGGTLKFESNLGSGTKATISLPIHRES